MNAKPWNDVFPATGDTLAAWFAAGGDPCAEDHNGSTPLHAAAANGRADIIAGLIAAGADHRAETKNCGNTPLHVAVHHRHPPAAAALLDAGADPAARDASGRTSLHVAMGLGVAERASMVLTLSMRCTPDQVMRAGLAGEDLAGFGHLCAVVSGAVHGGHPTLGQATAIILADAAAGHDPFGRATPDDEVAAACLAACAMAGDAPWTMRLLAALGDRT